MDHRDDTSRENAAGNDPGARGIRPIPLTLAWALANGVKVAKDFDDPTNEDQIDFFLGQYQIGADPWPAESEL